METLSQISSTEYVIATHCLYRNYRSLTNSKQRDLSDTDGIRGDLALKLVHKTLESRTRIVICDGGSSSDFLDTLRELQHQGLTLVNSATPGRGPQRRAAFQVAASLPNTAVIIYTQPEKVSLIDSLSTITKPIIEGNAVILIPKRNPQLFEQSYPAYMRLSELNVNKTYDRLMRKAGLMTQEQSFDWFFGPVVFKNDQEALALFLKQYELRNPIKSRIGAKPNPEMHSDGHYFPIIEALYRNMSVVAVEVPFVYPPTQKANEMTPEKIEEFKKRRAQDAAAYRLEAMHILAHLKGDPRNQIREVKAV